MSTTPNHVLDRIEKPYYYHHYPVFKRVKLPAVKHGIYNPHLPTLRHMDRDTVACKLPDEHCQSTNCCNPRDFALAELTGVSKSQKWHSCPDDTKTERTVSRLYFKPEDHERLMANWYRYLHDPVFRESKPCEAVLRLDNFDPNLLHFNGAHVVKQLPVERDLRMKLKCEPRLEPRYGQQQPTPSDINSRYRHVQPFFFRNLSDKMWVPPTPSAQHPDPPCSYFL